MSRPGGSLRDRMQGGAGAARPDKFAGALVEKRSGANDAPPAAADAGPPIRSSGLHAPFGQQSSAPPRGPGGRVGFGHPNSGVAASGNKALDRVFVAARRTGQLTMDNMSLQSFPPQVCSLYDESSITAEEKFWECADLLGISMQHNAIGSVPAEITNLMHLQVLGLAHNKIAELPQALTTLLSLKKIDCSHNALRSLPESLGELQNLVELTVSHNSLTMLPESLCDLARLEVLNVDHNALECLPPDMGLLRQLLRINASANRLQGLPSSMGECARLSTVEIKQNRLQSDPSAAPSSSSSRAAPRNAPAPRGSTGMPSFRALKDLVLLDLSENQLTRIPDLPRGSSKLAQVFFGFNALRDCSALLDCPGLVTIDLHNNKLEALPRELGRRDCSIKLLDVSNNELSDIAGELGLITSLNKLLVDGNPLRKFPRAKLQAGGLGIEALKKYLITRIDAGALTQAVGETEAAEMLGGAGAGGPTNSANPDVEFAIREGSASASLNFSRIAPPLQTFPERLWALPSLGDIVSLDLSHSRIAPEAIPAQIALMKRCKIFVGNACAWTELPLAICSLLNLQELSLMGNALTTLPPNLAALRSLRKLNLNQNAFTRLPAVLCDPDVAAGLTHLSLANNKLATLPSDFCALFGAALMELDVGGNRLTALPDGWRGMSSAFQSLNVENNHIAALPLELGLCTGLKSLMAGGNPQRTVLYAVLAKGTPAILAALKLKIPEGSELLRETQQPEQQQQAGRSAPQPQGGARRQPARQADDDDGAIEVDTDQLRGRYADNRAGSSSSQRQLANAAPAASSSSFSARYAEAEDYRAPSGRDVAYDSRSSASRGGGGSRDYYQRGDDRDYAPRGSASRDYGRDAPPRRDQRDYNDDRSAEPRYDDRDRRDGYAAQPSSRSAAPPSASYARDQPRGSSYDRDDRSDSRYDDRSQQRRAPSYDEDNRRAQYDEPPARQQQSSQRPAVSSSVSGSGSSGSADLSSLQRAISQLEDQLENNLSLGNLQKLQKKKELAGLKAEFNRKQGR